MSVALILFELQHFRVIEVQLDTKGNFKDLADKIQAVNDPILQLQNNRQ